MPARPLPSPLPVMMPRITKVYKLYSLDTEVYNDDNLYREAFDSLSLSRREKIKALRMRKDKNLSLGAGVLLDRGLKEYGLCERNMEYGFIQNKKPVFLNAPDVHFNISHSGTMAIAAFSDSPVGCDIEMCAKADLKLSDRFFTEREAELLHLLPEKERDGMFYRLWTIKESYMKYTGEGMSLPLNAFEIIFTPDGPQIERNGEHAHVKITELQSFPGYKCAVIN